MIVLAACATPPAAPTLPPSIAPPAAALPPAPTSTPTETPPPPQPTTTPLQPTPTGQNTLLIHDAHLHYSADSAAVYTVDQVLAILDEAGIQRALFSSTPNEGTLLLYKQRPERIVPSLRPYRTRADITVWFNDETVVDYVKQELARGSYRAIGEFHVSGADAAKPVIKRIVELAVAENIFLHAHSDATAIEKLFEHHAEARVIWAHAGMSESVDTLDKMVERYPNLWIELSYRPDIALGDKIDPAWRDLFIRYPDRFVYGTDTWVKDRWLLLPDLARWARGWLAQLPPEVATKIATQNFEALFPEK